MQKTSRIISIFLMLGVLILSPACDSAPAAPPAADSPTQPSEPPSPPIPTLVPPTPTPEPTFADAVGSWGAYDMDGSYMTLQITRNEDGTFAMELTDEKASICGTDASGAPVRAMDFSFTAAAAGLTVEVAVVIGTCRETGQKFQADVTFTYQPASDTLMDGSGAIWERVE